MNRSLLATLLCAVLALAGCSSEQPQAAPSRSPSPSATSASSPPADPPPPPKRGSCHDLEAAQVARGSDESEPVRCRRRHTSVTIDVGRFDPVVDGHYLAVDSDRVQQQVREACPQALTDWVGDGVDPRLTRLRVIWFTPTLEEASAGARWYRCDVIAVEREGELASLRGTLRDVLNGPEALDTYGRCSTGDPATRQAERVICSLEHTWRAESIIEIEKRTRYENQAARERGDAACKAIAEERAEDPLQFEWRFEWPSQADFEDGQRYALCWLPTTDGQESSG